MAQTYDKLREKLFASERLPAASRQPAAEERHAHTFGTPSSVGPSLHLHDISSSTIASTVLTDHDHTAAASASRVGVALEARVRGGYSGAADAGLGDWLSPSVTPAKILGRVPQTPEGEGRHEAHSAHAASNNFQAPPLPPPPSGARSTTDGEHDAGVHAASHSFQAAACCFHLEESPHTHHTHHVHGANPSGGGGGAGEEGGGGGEVGEDGNCQQFQLSSQLGGSGKGHDLQLARMRQRLLDAEGKLVQSDQHRRALEVSCRAKIPMKE